MHSFHRDSSTKLEQAGVNGYPLLWNFIIRFVKIAQVTPFLVRDSSWGGEVETPVSLASYAPA